MNTSNVLRVIGIALNALGALILAIRLKRIVDALILVASCHEVSVLQLTKGAPPGLPQIHFTNSTAHVKRAQRLGTWLLALGFSMICLGAILQGVALLLDHGFTLSPPVDRLR